MTRRRRGKPLTPARAARPKRSAATARSRSSNPGESSPRQPRASARDRLRILVTAGPTREYLDPVRYFSNDSSGKMGFALAAAAALRGHRVSLVTGPVQLPTPAAVRRIDVVSAADMLHACRRLWRTHDVLIMAAAVADYSPARRARLKRKKGNAALVVRLVPTIDILATLARDRRASQLVVGFALEDRAARYRAAAKLRRKRLDAIVLNSPAAIAADRSRLEVLALPQPGSKSAAWRTLPLADKSAQAKLLLELIEDLARRRYAGPLPDSPRRGR